MMKKNNDDFFDDSFEILDESLINNSEQNADIPIRRKRITEENAPDIEPEKPITQKKKKFNRYILNQTILFAFLFLGMIGYLVYFEYKDADEVINNNYNKRQAILDKSVYRGEIRASNGEVLAKSITNADGSKTRIYPYGDLFAHAVGYNCNGKAGLELSANFKLLTSNANLLLQIKDDLFGDQHPGDSVITTLDVNLQNSAYSAIGNNKGAIIAIDPSTGRILTMVSKPDFDPNTIESDWDYIVNEEGNTCLLNRATNGLYPPGSTFKLFTLLEYIHEHPNDYSNYTFDCSGTLTRGEYSIGCYNRNVHGHESLMDSFAYSCNSSFANIGLSLDMNKYKHLCKDLLFNSELPFSMTYSKSDFKLNEKSSTFEIMQTVIGQGKTQITPLHLSLVASALANNGVLMRPYMIDHVENVDGKVVKQYEPEKSKTLFSEEDAKKLSEFMGAVVSYGTGTKLQSSAYTAYGKTGTAQFDSGDNSHSLFMGYAENGSKKLAICVVMEDMPAGSTWAVPAAREVFDTYFAS